MSSLTMCSGQGVLVQGEEKGKECVVEDIRNKFSHQERRCSRLSILHSA